MNTLPQGRDKLYWLIDLLLADHHDLGSFCRNYELTFNYEVDKTTLSSTERSAFKALFDKVVYYCPFPDELESYPTYQSAEQVRQAVSEARATLENARSTPSVS